MEALKIDLGIKGNCYEGFEVFNFLRTKMGKHYLQTGQKEKSVPRKEIYISEALKFDLGIGGIYYEGFVVLNFSHTKGGVY